MNFIGGMIIGGAATLFVILLCASGKDDDK